ncbi:MULTISPECIES: ATP-grasp domain-containing protein [Sphingobium]|jgi:carbamoyl-phosphate synthase large subunit|uniref:ATP-grasp domain-containing protein n=3 Tax=Sphingobium yanoikuyae TaxID=13690 RepID=A0A2D1R6R8_SPHYA|nr:MULTISPECIES: ATP-grasp domain-containing protein [Sphingobium]TKV44206.1 hypothetical protein A0U87_09675 [Sphingobium sp. MP9-4]ATP20548.1 hypothetical protein BV87_20655 [Sphingobium yanoikuyae]NBB39537.1 ATP-grasp domain-containing protein [Sphingobium yanoikuyae]PZU70924.1 MAG: hypothetical protein DI540_00235 [Sphingobium sp.]RSU57561.1 ATP-grasp domain-containing protein [Sphingobium yanoikuyae]
MNMPVVFEPTQEGAVTLVANSGRRASSRRSLRMMMSSAGRRVSLLRSFRQSAAQLGADLSIYGCDLQPEWSPACIEADKAFAAPSAESTAFIPAMLEICEQENIGLIVPTIDTELIAFARARDKFAALGCHVAVSSEQVVTMARDKLATARFLSAAGVHTPRTASAKDVLRGREEMVFPLLAKPRHGSSSRGIMMVETLNELLTLDAKEPYIVQQFIPGREFTVNLYFDAEGRLKCAVPHERLKVRAGEVEKGVTLRSQPLADMARQIAAACKGARGALCFQVRLAENGMPFVFEINARFGGGYPLTHHAGAQFTTWMLEECLNLPRTANDEWQSDMLMLRFDDAVFV